MMPEPGVEADCRLLFVYGTLRRGFELHHHLVRLGARFRAKARVAAELFDLGRYLGARPADRKGEWVCGELFQLRQLKHDLTVLDEVEVFIPGTPERSEFVRTVAEVILNNGTRQRAWIYWLGAKARTTRRRVASGDYATWQARRALS
jgi:gamma-glutamylcyclotransferase (GGCT)/AIG2-like uncharacterized protein YtfP